MSMLWAALFDVRPSGAPRGTIWRSQIDPCLWWLKAFLTIQVGSITRRFYFLQHYNIDNTVIIGLDASPDGIGGWLYMHNAVVSYFSSTITATDRDMLGISDAVGSAGQQAAEALAILVSLRLWHRHWSTARTRLVVRGDNVAALTLLVKLQPKSASLTLVARELASDICQGLYEPDVQEHIAGISNDAADYLSRPNRLSSEPLPEFLALAPAATVPPRPVEWWKYVAIARQGSQDKRNRNL